MVDLVFWITSVESEYVHTQYVVQAPAVSPGPLSCNGVWNGAEVSQPAPPCSSIAQQQHLSSDNHESKDATRKYQMRALSPR